eukprot:5520239-Pleurochrysis_carterae.AAC.1
MSDMLFAALDPLYMWNVLRRCWPGNATHSRDVARSARRHHEKHAAEPPPARTPAVAQGPT